MAEVPETPPFYERRHPKYALKNVEVVSVAAERHRVNLVCDGVLLEQLDARFLEALQLSERLAALTKSLELLGSRFCVFGGWVRDTIHNMQAMPLEAPPRDIDIVVSGLEIDDLRRRLPSDVRPTMFGGIQSSAGPLAFDIWPLHETFLVHYLNLSPTFENLLQSTDFTINAALFFPRQGADPPEIMDGGMLEALRTHTLAFNSPHLPFPVMQCARLAAYAGKLSLDLAPAVRAFMVGIVADPEKREQVCLGLREHYPLSISSRGLQILQGLVEDSR